MVKSFECEEEALEIAVKSWGYFVDIELVFIYNMVYIRLTKIKT